MIERYSVGGGSETTIYRSTAKSIASPTGHAIRSKKVRMQQDDMKQLGPVPIHGGWERSGWQRAAEGLTATAEFLVEAGIKGGAGEADVRLVTWGLRMAFVDCDDDYIHSGQDHKNQIIW